MAPSRERPQGSREHPSHYLIEGNFKPAKGTRLLRAVVKVFGVLLVLVCVSSLIVYGFTVHYESKTSQVAKQTTHLHEDNHALEIQLEQVKSFKHVEAAAGKAPQLHIAKDIIEATAPPPGLLSLPPKTVHHPKVYVY